MASRFWLAVDRLRMVLPVIEFDPAVVEIPISRPPVKGPEKLLFTLATTLSAIVEPATLELIIPITCCPAVELKAAEEALRLLALVVLPMMLLEMVLVPVVTRMPMMEAPTATEVPLEVMEPIVLLVMVAPRALLEPMPITVPPAPDVVILIESVPVALPIVFPVAVPMLTMPAWT